MSELEEFCKLNGAREVHRSWRDNMLAQGRGVSPERMEWDTLPDIDKALDARISMDVIQDYLVWASSRAALAALSRDGTDRGKE